MRSLFLIPLILAFEVVSSPGLVGGGSKCPYDTQECLDRMMTQMKKSGWIGVEFDDGAQIAEGCYKITRVIPGSPAEGAGLRPGDILFAMNGIVFNPGNMEKIRTAKKDMKPGVSVVYTLKRDGHERPVSITLAPMPADV